MTDDEPQPIPVDRTDLVYLHYALAAFVHDLVNDNGTILAILDVQQIALEITDALLGLQPGRPFVVCAGPSVPPAPELPFPGSVERNPLLPELVPTDEPVKEPLAAVVYGVLDRFGGFAFLDEGDADAVVGEIAALNGVRTLGELRALYPTLEHVHGPIDPAEDIWPYEPDDHPVDLHRYESWPPFVTYYSEYVLPAAVIDDLNQQAALEWHQQPAFDTEFFLVPVGREADMLAVLARHGIAARRDDALIDGFGE